MTPGKVLLVSILVGLVGWYALTATQFVIGGASVAEALSQAASSMVREKQ